jgi:hypothetical protein
MVGRTSTQRMKIGLGVRRRTTRRRTRARRKRRTAKGTLRRRQVTSTGASITLG